MAVREQMLAILRSGETSRIRFSFTGSTGITIQVNASSFQRVIAAIVDGRISVNDSSSVAAGWAQYDSATNSFNIGSTSESYSRAYNALLVHESVHASFDLSRSVLPWIDNECAAYIAQGYYLRNSGFRRARLDELGQPYLGYLLVEKIVRDGTIDTQLMDELKGTLLSSPQYASYIHGTFRGNG